MIEFTRWPDQFARHYRAAGHWIDAPLTRGFQAQVAARPDATAIICGARQLSYAEADRLATNLAARLSAHGFGHGDTALVQLPNLAEFYLIFLALLKIGVAPVNALFSHRLLEMSSYASQISPALLIGARGHELFRDDAFLDRCEGLRLALFLGDGGPQDLKDWLNTPATLPADARPTPPDEVAFFQLSGGSTGTPKLIPRTHNDYDYSIRESVRICGFTEATRYLSALPAPHNFAMSSPGALGVFDAGGTVVIADNPDPTLCFPLIQQHRVTTVALVPPAVALWQSAVLADPGAGAQIASLDLMLVGGANFAEAQARRVPELLGCRLQQVFGMAEGLVNYTRAGDSEAVTFTTQGRPISPDDEIRILDASGAPVPDGTPGHLAVRGPYTFRGYYRAPAHNTTAFDAEGFYITGDIVERVHGGNLRVVGRVKDQINRGGEKIAAEEIENLLLRHPAVQQAALVAVADETLGEKSNAIIVLRDGEAATAMVLRRHLLALGIAEYKLPDRFRFVADLPLTAVGKIDKLRLRQAEFDLQQSRRMTL
ncbi:(2,3-dihydroxybenzoyl)adenylate synthase [Paracoccus sulfuroxidans]|uniref:2,3-dihydroxybenzoate-AMP ligase n=1 Tax=Paracoccus sulfuroxidans TaxID=384678 RepID=A0A562NGR6_9RHOB|nr:(2,3-dihydroxybenzoyl)adenylate synthase [Paracoccus sulfuroxidans]TWI31270.1 2,3-dihydroxybenzoate-AMP ligase [Paracoccus sulfuroxidans]